MTDSKKPTAKKIESEEEVHDLDEVVDTPSDEPAQTDPPEEAPATPIIFNLDEVKNSDSSTEHRPEVQTPRSKD